MDKDEGKFDLKIISQRWWKKYHIPVVPKNVSVRLRTATTIAERTTAKMIQCKMYYRKQQMTHYLDRLRPEKDPIKRRRSPARTSPIGPPTRVQREGWRPFGKSELKRNQEEIKFLLLLMRSGSYKRRERIIMLLRMKQTRRRYLHGVFFIIALRYRLVGLFFPLR